MVNPTSVFGALVAFAVITVASPVRDRDARESFGRNKGIFRGIRNRNDTHGRPWETGNVAVPIETPVSSVVLPVSSKLPLPETVETPFTVTYTIGARESARAVTKTFTKTETIYPTLPVDTPATTPAPAAPSSPSAEDSEEVPADLSDDKDDVEDEEGEETVEKEEPCKAKTTVTEMIEVTATETIEVTATVTQSFTVTVTPSSVDSAPDVVRTPVSSEVHSTTTIYTSVTTFWGTGGVAAPTGAGFFKYKY
ncbi:hypothetical protein EX30DRAFT_59320 [Ascodesmis nigricans]|uniref:Uncharacterized protein n=1 Tax=Ascodesmis nigricans TaxID=341454 RepID=A0A4S2MV00_9PEZI|nr:hypothetical protein EX30DRAFT_59320 [Ascodesmis nigricans]